MKCPSPIAPSAPAAPDRLALDAIPAPLRDIAVATGCAADYDGWLIGVAG